MVTTEVCYWHLGGETKDTAKSPTEDRTAPTTKNNLSQDLSYAKVEKS